MDRIGGLKSNVVSEIFTLDEQVAAVKAWREKKEAEGRVWPPAEITAIEHLVTDVLVPRAKIVGRKVETISTGDRKVKAIVDPILEGFSGERRKALGHIAQGIVRELANQCLEQRSIFKEESLRARSVGTPQLKQGGTDPIRFESDSGESGTHFADTV